LLFLLTLHFLFCKSFGLIILCLKGSFKNPTSKKNPVPQLVFNIHYFPPPPSHHPPCVFSLFDLHYYYMHGTLCSAMFNSVFIFSDDFRFAYLGHYVSLVNGSSAEENINVQYVKCLYCYNHYYVSWYWTKNARIPQLKNRK